MPTRQAYLDGELCGLRPDGVTSFALIQNAAEPRDGADLVYFVFDLLHLHWVRPELVVDVKYLTWTEDGLLQQVVYEGICEDNPAREVVRG